MLRVHLGGFRLPAEVETCRANLEHWAKLIASGRADAFKEQELLPDFLTDIFCNLLGYARPADGDQRYTISREKHVQVDGGFADAVLGEFGTRKTESTASSQRKAEFIPPSSAQPERNEFRSTGITHQRRREPCSRRNQATPGPIRGRSPPRQRTPAIRHAKKHPLISPPQRRPPPSPARMPLAGYPREIPGGAYLSRSEL
jgi:hypothetical protein